MSKTEELMKVVTELLKRSCSRTYYEDTKENTSFPYQVYAFDGKLDSDPREDVTLIVDVWDKSDSWVAAETLADTIETNLHKLNYPKGIVLPTFYQMDRRNLKDPDKKLKHIQLKYQIQVYYKEERNG